MTSNAEKQLKSEAQDASRVAKEKVMQSGQKFKDQASDRIFSITGVIRSASQNFSSHNESRIADGLNRLASIGESLATTLRDQGPQQLYRKVEYYGRRNPWTIFALASVIGFLVMRTSKTAASQSESLTESEPESRLDLAHKSTVRRVG